ncbi:hypothetical protein L209DRAFT_703031 [Thermothelomyces heterothallicus CBS 203.75]
MVSVAELLNPASPTPPRAPLPTSRPLCFPARQTVAPSNEQAPVTPSIEVLRMTQNAGGPPRRKTRAVVNFPPFEVLDEHSIREVHRFRVHPFGSIQETGERIPYNSGKKDFFSKTGREGFEAFHYNFKVPGDDTDYTVMWDHNVGLVRMTPFFKCRGYSKTTPAKMLNLNPGLKDITYSITGGSIKAQGYWMPYSCAKAVCATFCHKISGALIPLFGPRFPLECIPEKAPGYGRMVIDPDIVKRARKDAAALFRPSAALPSPRPSRSVSPLLAQRSVRVSNPHDLHSDHDQRLPISPYTDPDADYRLGGSDHEGLRPYATSVAPLRIPTSRLPTGPAAVPTPQHSPAWTTANHPPPPQAYAASHHHIRRATPNLHEELPSLNLSATANPWLSAVPRSPIPGVVGVGGSGGGSGGSTKRWHPYKPRSHQSRYGHFEHLHHGTSPISATLPERGIILPPLRLKRRFSKVDATVTGPRGNRSVDDRKVDSNINDNNDHNTDDDAAYDARESHAASSWKRNSNGNGSSGSGSGSSPVSVTAAPPPTPASASSKKSKSSSSSTPPPLPRAAVRTDNTDAAAATTTTTIISVAASAQSKPGNNNNNKTAPRRRDDDNDNDSDDDGGDGSRAAGRGRGAPPRRKSERDAAMMLMRMRRRGGGSSSSSSSSLGGSDVEEGDEEEGRAGAGAGAGAGGGRGKAERRREEDTDAGAEPRSPRTARHRRHLLGGAVVAAEDDTEAGAGAAPGAVRPASSYMPPPAAIGMAIVADGLVIEPPHPPRPASAGPTTRSKRRRTLER